MGSTVDILLWVFFIDFNIFKNGFQIWIQHEISKKMICITFIFSKYFFRAYGDFSNNKSSIRNPMDDFYFFYYNIFYKVKTQLPQVGG